MEAWPFGTEPPTGRSSGVAHHGVRRRDTRRLWPAPGDTLGGSRILESSLVRRTEDFWYIEYRDLG